MEQTLKQKSEGLKLYQVRLKKAQGEIYKAQDALVVVEKMRDEAEQATAEARSIAKRLREQRLMDIAREGGRRVGLQEGLAGGQETDYIDWGYDYWKEAQPWRSWTMTITAGQRGVAIHLLPGLPPPPLLPSLMDEAEVKLRESRTHQRRGF